MQEFHHDANLFDFAMKNPLFVFLPFLCHVMKPLAPLLVRFVLFVFIQLFEYFIMAMVPTNEANNKQVMASSQ
jgi:hypothetical protein